MMLVYLDASVWIKRYVLEEGSRRVQEWFRRGPVVATSPLALIEVMATLVRKARSGELSGDDRDTLLDAVEKDYARFAVVPLSSGVVDESRYVARYYGLRGADTIHLAAARWIAGEAVFKDAPVGLVTSDRELADVAESTGMNVFDPTRDALPSP